MSKTTTKFVFRKADAERVILWPCKISVPIDDKGTREDQQVTAKFKLASNEKIMESFGPMAVLRDNGSNGENFLKDYLVGFDNLKNENNETVSDEDAKALLLSLPYGIDGLVQGYFDMIGRRLTKN